MIIDPRLPERIAWLLIPEPNSGCWLYVGQWNSGNEYAKVMYEGQTWMLHRLVWTKIMGPICPGFVLDHKKWLCGNRWCSNPYHLDPVTTEINTGRGRAHLTQFKRVVDYIRQIP